VPRLAGSVCAHSRRSLGRFDLPRVLSGWRGTDGPPTMSKQTSTVSNSCVFPQRSHSNLAHSDHLKWVDAHAAAASENGSKRRSSHKDLSIGAGSMVVSTDRPRRSVCASWSPDHGYPEDRSQPFTRRTNTDRPVWRPTAFYSMRQRSTTTTDTVVETKRARGWSLLILGINDQQVLSIGCRDRGAR
jgi:hypothetical protein